MSNRKSKGGDARTARGRSSSNAPSRNRRKGAGPESGPPRLNAVNLAGLTELMNPQNIRKGVDLDAAEKSVMGKKGGGKGRESKIDPMDLYDQELKELAGDLGIDFEDDGDPSAPGDSKKEPRPPEKQPKPETRDAPKVQNPLGDDSIQSLLGELDLDDDSLGSDSDDESAAGDDGDDGDDGTDAGDSDESSGSDDSGGSDDSDDSSTSSDSEEGDESDSDGGGSDADSVLSELGRKYGIDFEATRRHGKRRNRVRLSEKQSNVPSRRGRLRKLTEEQERREHINSVLHGMRREAKTSYGVEHERIQDAKAEKLEKIGQLRMTLEEEDIDCSGVGTPNMSSEMSEIDSVLSILKLKNDRNRYSTIAEEIILGAAEGIGTILDGTREIPIVGWKPDYTGYQNTVNAKLHRMRFETSQFVGKIIEKYNFGNGTRMLIELLPSFFLYPRQRKKQRGTPGIYSDFEKGNSQGRTPQIADARGAYSSIRRAEAPNPLSEVADI
jgi:hypothetical protein